MNRRGFFAALAGMVLAPLVPSRVQSVDDLIRSFSFSILKGPSIEIKPGLPIMRDAIAQINRIEDYIVTKIDPSLEDCWVEAIRYRLTRGHTARERTLEDVALRKVVKIVPVV